MSLTSDSITDDIITTRLMIKRAEIFLSKCTDKETRKVLENDIAYDKRRLAEYAEKYPELFI